MKRIGIAVLAVMLVLPVAAIGWAQEPAAKSKESSEPASWKTEEKAEESATVAAIDHSTRKVTLKVAEDKFVTFKAGKNIKHLDKIQAGDVVKFTYYESLAVRVMKKGEADPAVGQAGVVARGQAGQPGGVAASEKTFIVTVEAIDKKAKTATLKGDDGKSVTVTPRDPKRLDQAKVGDRLEITHTEAIAVKVEKKAEKK